MRMSLLGVNLEFDAVLTLKKRISLSVDDLEGNIFVVNVVMGLMEIAAVTVLMFNLDRLRKISQNNSDYFEHLCEFHAVVKIVKTEHNCEMNQAAIK